MSNRNRLYVFLIALIFLSGIWIVNNYKPAIERITTSIAENSSGTSGREDNDLVSIYTDIHHMSHNVVIADEKWGYRDLTLENIDKLYNELDGIEGQDSIKEELYEILERWRNGDFSRAHHDHNYVWRRLGGTVGKATGVDTRNLPDWAVH